MPPRLSSMVRFFLSFLVGFGFLVLVACAGGGGGSSGSGNSGDDPFILAFSPFDGRVNITLTNGVSYAGRNITAIQIEATSYDGDGSPTDYVNRPDLSLGELISGYIFTGLMSGEEYEFTFFYEETLMNGTQVKREIEWRPVARNRADYNDTEGGAVRGRIGIGEDGDGNGIADFLDRKFKEASAGDPDDNVVGEDPDNGTMAGEEDIAMSEMVAGCVLVGDCDNDSVMDGEDIDDDGDGLIEIATAVELDAVRYALNGNGRKLSMEEALNTTGCGDGKTVITCNGYELTTDISLAAYSGNEGWQPLSHDIDNSTQSCDGTPFKGVFEGNGWTISDLSINRSKENCVGLFGQITNNATIRNLNLHAKSVIGRDRVGGLAGFIFESQIVSSFIVVAEVSGNDRIGGLAGWVNASGIVSSSVVANGVRGTNSVGGLMGIGPGVGYPILSSSVVVGEVSGTNYVGGLLGGGVGNLVPSGYEILSSSVVVGEVKGIDKVGGLVGEENSPVDNKVAYSYVVMGRNTTTVGMLVGSGSGDVVASYWDSETSGITSGNLGEPKTSSELRMPTGYEEIYDTWDDGADIDDHTGIDNITIYCDKDNSGSIETAERTDENRVWDFGTSMQYPAIRCTPLSPAEWRSWWSLDGDGKPQLDQTRLDNLLPSPN